MKWNKRSGCHENKYIFQQTSVFALLRTQGCNTAMLKMISTWVIIPALLFYFLLVRRTIHKRRKLPPGPPCLPVIGNLHMLKDLVYRSLKELSDKHGPIMSLRLGTTETLVISSSEAAELVFKAHDLAFSSRPPLAVGKHLFFYNQDVMFSKEWRHLRKIVTSELLSAKKVESHRDLREEEVSFMLSDIWSLSDCGKVPVNLSNAFYSTRYNVLWRMLAGKSFPEKMKEFKHIIDGVSYTLGAFYIGDYIPWLGWVDVGGLKRRMNKTRQDFDDFVENLLREYDGSPFQEANNFIDAMLKISKNDVVFTRDCIKAIILNMLVGGAETTGATLEWTMSLLLKHPHCVLGLQQEIDETVGIERAVVEKDLMKMKYLQSVVKEAMRLYPVVPLAIPHECSEKLELRTGDGHCYKIEKGTRLIANLWAIGRDPRVWENAEEFHPERFMDHSNIDLGGLSDMKSIPFGAGRRVCPGIAMAIPTILLVIARLFHEFDWTVDGDPKDIDMSEKMGGGISKKRHLFATPKLRHGTAFRGSSGV